MGTGTGSGSGPRQGHGAALGGSTDSSTKSNSYAAGCTRYCAICVRNFMGKPTTTNTERWLQLTVRNHHPHWQQRRPEALIVTSLLPESSQFPPLPLPLPKINTSSGWLTSCPMIIFYGSMITILASCTTIHHLGFIGGVMLAQLLVKRRTKCHIVLHRYASCTEISFISTLN